MNFISSLIKAASPALAHSFNPLADIDHEYLKLSTAWALGFPAQPIHLAHSQTQSLLAVLLQNGKIVISGSSFEKTVSSGHKPSLEFGAIFFAFLNRHLLIASSSTLTAYNLYNNETQSFDFDTEIMACCVFKDTSLVFVATESKISIYDLLGKCLSDYIVNTSDMIGDWYSRNSALKSNVKSNESQQPFVVSVQEMSGLLLIGFLDGTAVVWDLAKRKIVIRSVRSEENGDSICFGSFWRPEG